MNPNLSDVNSCRQYINLASKSLLTNSDKVPATYIKTSAGKKYTFNNLTDEEAIKVANMIWSDIHKEVARDLN